MSVGPDNFSIVWDAIDAFRQVDGYHKASQEELLEHFGLFLLERLSWQEPAPPPTTGTTVEDVLRAGLVARCDYDSVMRPVSWIDGIEEAAATINQAFISPLVDQVEQARVTNAELHRRVQAAEGPLLARATAAEASSEFWRARRIEQGGISASRLQRINELEAEVRTLEYRRRWNVEEGDNGVVRLCRGDHDRSDNCEWEDFVPRERLVALQEELASLRPAEPG